LKLTDESTGTGCHESGAATRANPGSPRTANEQLPTVPAAHPRPVPAPPSTRLRAIQGQPSRARNREHEVRRLIHDLALLAERQYQR